MNPNGCDVLLGMWLGVGPGADGKNILVQCDGAIADAPEQPAVDGGEGGTTTPGCTEDEAEVDYSEEDGDSEGVDEINDLGDY